MTQNKKAASLVISADDGNIRLANCHDTFLQVDEGDRITVIREVSS